MAGIKLVKRCVLKIMVIILFINLFVITTISLNTQEEQQQESAEIVAYIDTPNNRIPPIGISNWTIINITVLDAYGINWSYLSQEFPILSQYVWPIIHPSWKPFLGLSSLRFETEIIDGNPKGWYTKITPSAIPSADQGRIYKLKLEVQTDDIAVDYAVVVGIKTTRVNVFGVDSGISYIYVPVKASSLNNIKMETAITNKETSPFSYVYFDLNIKNYGYYRDMFSLEFITENGLIVSATEQLFVLEPGESGNVEISVLTPEKLFDIGTPNKIEVYVTSSSDETPILIGTLVVVTRGIYITPLAVIIAVPIIIMIILIYLYYNNYKNKKEIEIFGKPDKPWKIKEEKKYLEEIREKNKDEYVKTIDMMKDEYKSAILWYKDYMKNKKSDKSNISNSTEILKNFFKNQKNNLKNIRKQDNKKEKIKKTKIESNSKKIKNKESKRKIFSSITKKLGFKKEIKDSHEKDILNKNLKDKKENHKKKTIIDKEEEDKINKIKFIDNVKNLRKEKILNKIKKDEDKQRRKFKK
jgi:hypothetical protein